MINLNCNVNTLRYKFLNSITNLFDMCGSENIIENIRKGQDPTNPRWATSVIHEMYYVFEQRWLEEVNNKSSLKHYAKFKINPGLEKYLLDRTGFYGASMKFKLRSNTLPLDRRICNWTPNNTGICTICDSNCEEDIKHFLFSCTALNDIRVHEYMKLKNDLTLCNCNDVWQSFCSADIDFQLCLTLGDTTYEHNNDVLSAFDKFCKSYAIRAWKKRSELKNN